MNSKNSKWTAHLWTGVALLAVLAWANVAQVEARRGPGCEKLCGCGARIGDGWRNGDCGGTGNCRWVECTNHIGNLEYCPAVYSDSNHNDYCGVMIDCLADCGGVEG
jgi:hypothetical protein